MEELRITLKPTENPFPTDISSQRDIWAFVEISIFNKFDQKIILWNITWDIKYFINWFFRSYPIFSEYEFILPKLEGESLAEINNRYIEHIMALYDFEDPVDDRDYNKDECDKVELMSQSMLQLSGFFGDERSLHEAFTGTITPHIIIGINNGIGEISLVDKEKYINWKYNFDMQQFINGTLLEIKKALLEYKENYYNPDIRDEYENLLNEVNKHIKNNS